MSLLKELLTKKINHTFELHTSEVMATLDHVANLPAEDILISDVTSLAELIPNVTPVEVTVKPEMEDSSQVSEMTTSSLKVMVSPEKLSSGNGIMVSNVLLLADGKSNSEESTAPGEIQISNVQSIEDITPEKTLELPSMPEVETESQSKVILKSEMILPKVEPETQISEVEPDVEIPQSMVQSQDVMVKAKVTSVLQDSGIGDNNLTLDKIKTEITPDSSILTMQVKSELTLENSDDMPILVNANTILNVPSVSDAVSDSKMSKLKETSEITRLISSNQIKSQVILEDLGEIPILVDANTIPKVPVSISSSISVTKMSKPNDSIGITELAVKDTVMKEIEIDTLVSATRRLSALSAPQLLTTESEVTQSKTENSLLALETITKNLGLKGMLNIKTKARIPIQSEATTPKSKRSKTVAVDTLIKQYKNTKPVSGTSGPLPSKPAAPTSASYRKLKKIAKRPSQVNSRRIQLQKIKPKMPISPYSKLMLNSSQVAATSKTTQTKEDPTVKEGDTSQKNEIAEKWGSLTELETISELYIKHEILFNAGNEIKQPFAYLQVLKELAMNLNIEYQSLKSLLIKFRIDLFEEVRRRVRARMAARHERQGAGARLAPGRHVLRGAPPALAALARRLRLVTPAIQAEFHPANKPALEWAVREYVTALVRGARRHCALRASLAVREDPATATDNALLEAVAEMGAYAALLPPHKPQQIWSKICFLKREQFVRWLRLPGENHPCMVLDDVDWLVVDSFVLYSHDYIMPLVTKSCLELEHRLRSLTALVQILSAARGEVQRADLCPRPRDAQRAQLWARVLAAYRRTGRVATLLLLQRMWQQLCGVVREVLLCSPRAPPLALLVAKMFPYVVLQEPETWLDLVRTNRVVTDDDIPKGFIDDKPIRINFIELEQCSERPLKFIYLDKLLRKKEGLTIFFDNIADRIPISEQLKKLYPNKTEPYYFGNKTQEINEVDTAIETLEKINPEDTQVKVIIEEDEKDEDMDFEKQIDKVNDQLLKKQKNGPKTIACYDPYKSVFTTWITEGPMPMSRKRLIDAIRGKAMKDKGCKNKRVRDEKVKEAEKFQIIKCNVAASNKQLFKYKPCVCLLRVEQTEVWRRRARLHRREVSAGRPRVRHADLTTSAARPEPHAEAKASNKKKEDEIVVIYSSDSEEDTSLARLRLKTEKQQPVTIKQKCICKYSLKPELKGLSKTFLARNKKLLERFKPTVVRLKESDRPKSGRVVKKVELADIDEVRRINKSILTAQVVPITKEQPAEMKETSEPEPAVKQACQDPLGMEVESSEAKAIFMENIAVPSATTEGLTKNQEIRRFVTELASLAGPAVVAAAQASAKSRVDEPTPASSALQRRRDDLLLADMHKIRIRIENLFLGSRHPVPALDLITAAITTDNNPDVPYVPTGDVLTAKQKEQTIPTLNPSQNPHASEPLTIYPKTTAKQKEQTIPTLNPFQNPHASEPLTIYPKTTAKQKEQTIPTLNPSQNPHASEPLTIYPKTTAKQKEQTIPTLNPSQNPHASEPLTIYPKTTAKQKEQTIQELKPTQNPDTLKPLMKYRKTKRAKAKTPEPEMHKEVEEEAEDLENVLSKTIIQNIVTPDGGGSVMVVEQHDVTVPVISDVCSLTTAKPATGGIGDSPAILSTPHRKTIIGPAPLITNYKRKRTSQAKLKHELSAAARAVRGADTPSNSHLTIMQGPQPQQQLVLSPIPGGTLFQVQTLGTSDGKAGRFANHANLANVGQVATMNVGNVPNIGTMANVGAMANVGPNSGANVGNTTNIGIGTANVTANTANVANMTNPNVPRNIIPVLMPCNMNGGMNVVLAPNSSMPLLLMPNSTNSLSRLFFMPPAAPQAPPDNFTNSMMTLPVITNSQSIGTINLDDEQTDKWVEPGRIEPPSCLWVGETISPKLVQHCTTIIRLDSRKPLWTVGGRYLVLTERYLQCEDPTYWTTTRPNRAIVFPRMEEEDFSYSFENDSDLEDALKLNQRSRIDVKSTLNDVSSIVEPKKDESNTIVVSNGSGSKSKLGEKSGKSIVVLDRSDSESKEDEKSRTIDVSSEIDSEPKQAEKSMTSDDVSSKIDLEPNQEEKSIPSAELSSGIDSESKKDERSRTTIDVSSRTDSGLTLKVKAFARVQDSPPKGKKTRRCERRANLIVYNNSYFKKTSHHPLRYALILSVVHSTEQCDELLRERAALYVCDRARGRVLPLVCRRPSAAERPWVAAEALLVQYPSDHFLKEIAVQFQRLNSESSRKKPNQVYVFAPLANENPLSQPKTNDPSPSDEPILIPD